MALRLEQKQAIVGEVQEAAGDALAAILADYRGMNVAELTDLRRRARESNVYVRVVANTLLKRAVAGTEYECLNEAANGPTMLAFSRGDPGSAARLFKEVSREFEALEVKAVSIGGHVYPGEDIDRVASLPTKEGALSMLASVLQAPIAKLTRTLNEIPSGLARALAAVGERKSAVPESPAEVD